MPENLIEVGSGAASSDGGPRREALQLLDEKQRIEREMAQHSAVLAQNGADMNSPLVDAEGFPRDDLDVYAVRHARAAIRRLQTDHTCTMRAIERALCELHGKGEGASTDRVVENEEESSPFLLITDVLKNSPASEAGIKTGDRVCQLGDVTAASYGGSLVQLGQQLHDWRGRQLQLKLLRAGELLQLALTPREWGGRGLTGCRFVSLDQPER